jgi:hypothetical protein
MQPDQQSPRCKTPAGTTDGCIRIRQHPTERNIVTNLKLPPLTYDSLATILGGAPYRKIGYATTVERDYRYKDIISVVHHGSVIVDVSPGEVLLRKVGHHSQTTAHRMNRACVDNGLETRVGFRKGWLCMLLQSNGKQVEYQIKDDHTLFIGVD